MITSTKGQRFEIPKVKGLIQGKNTIITNITEIANYIRRPVEHLAKFLQKELAASGKILNERLFLNTKLNSNKVNEKVELYAKEGYSEKQVRDFLLSKGYALKDINNAFASMQQK